MTTLPKIWITRIEEREGINMAKLEEVCESLAKKDATFKYEINEKNLYIISPTKDIAMRRGVWFRAKVCSEILFRIYYKKVYRKGLNLLYIPLT